MTGNNEFISMAIAHGASSITGVKVERFKVGDRFSIRVVDNADALIMGSPSIYRQIAPSLRLILQQLEQLQNSQELSLRGMKGAAFGTFKWDGGGHIERIETRLQQLGIKIVAPLLAAPEAPAPMTLDRAVFRQAHELGKIVAEACS